MDFWTDYLNEDQRKLVKEFLKGKTRPDIYIEEDVSGARDYHFEIMQTGIGDNVVCVCNGERLWIDMGN